MALKAWTLQPDGTARAADTKDDIDDIVGAFEKVSGKRIVDLIHAINAGVNH